LARRYFAARPNSHHSQLVGCQAPRLAREEGTTVTSTRHLRRSRHVTSCNRAQLVLHHSSSARSSSALTRHASATSLSVSLVFFLQSSQDRSRDAASVMASRTPSASVSRSVSSGSLPSRHASPAIHLSPAEKEKETLVRAAIDNGDVDALVHLATSASGLVSDSLRCTACRPPSHRFHNLANVQKGRSC